jgi:hypothetical protein
MVRTAGSGARPVWATDYDDEEEEDVSEEAVSEDEYRPSKAVEILSSLCFLYSLYIFLSSRKELNSSLVTRIP